MKYLWSEELTSLLEATEVGGRDDQDWVPRDEADLQNWAFLGRKVGSYDRTRRQALMYIETGANTTPTQVSVRIQGFVERATLSTLGNWQG